MSQATTQPLDAGLLGSAERPLRVAIVGAGPSGFYAADALLDDGCEVRVDLFDRLPTPFGLVRGGVAPDHANIKRVVRVYEQIARDPRMRFFGNVEVGIDLAASRLAEAYDAVIYAIGGELGQSLGVPGEELQGVWSAAKLVFWYNGHPDHTHHDFELERVRRVAVVGNGNVAMDVARVLARRPAELAPTDIATHAQVALEASAVEQVQVWGRRGPVQAAYTPRELAEIDKLEGVEVRIAPGTFPLDPVTQDWLIEFPDDRAVLKNLDILHGLPQWTGEDPLPEEGREVLLRFLISPLAFEGDAEGRVTHVVLGLNRLVHTPSGRIGTQATGETWKEPVDLVLTAIGYMSRPIEGVPFDDWRGLIPNREGRVVDQEEVLPGQYVVGWAKRGPTGLIGTNKGDAVATVVHLLADLVGKEPRPGLAPFELTPELTEAGVRVVTWQDWERLDAEELRRGEVARKARDKLVAVAEMLAHLDQD